MEITVETLIQVNPSLAKGPLVIFFYDVGACSLLRRTIEPFSIFLHVVRLVTPKKKVIRRI